jgi:hypothetical protein
MPFINFDADDPARRGFVKEAINTDFVLRAYYDAGTSNITLHLTYESGVSKGYRGAQATDLYKHLRALPDFLEVPRDEGVEAFDLVNLNYARHLFYRDKANSEDGKSSLTIEYGVSPESTGSTTAGRGSAPYARFVVLHEDEAERVWNKYRGSAL